MPKQIHKHTLICDPSGFTSQHKNNCSVTAQTVVDSLAVYLHFGKNTLD